MPLWSEYKAHSQERGSLAFELFVVNTQPAGDMELVKATLPDHLAYIGSLETAGSLFLAGPVSDETGEHMQAAGMVILRAASMEEARKLADGDPMHSTGARTYTLKKWLVNEGRLNVSVSLGTQGASLT